MPWVPETNTPPFGIGVGGTNSATVITTPTASSWAGWDSNRNFFANNVGSGINVTTTAGGTTTMTAASAQVQFFGGTLNETVVLPVTSTLTLGESYNIVNRSTGTITVQSSGGNTIQALEPNSNMIVVCISLSGTGIASWGKFYIVEADVSGAVLLAPTGDQTITGAYNLIMGTGSMVAPTMLPGNLSLTGSTISTVSANANMILSPNGSGYMIVGTATTNPLFASTPDNSFINYGNPGTRPGYIIATAYSASTNYAAAFNSVRSRSASLASNAALQAGDSIGLWDFRADTGTTIDSRAQILGSVTTVGTKIGTQLRFYTATNAGAAVALAMTLGDDQSATFATTVTAAGQITATAGALISGSTGGGTAGFLSLFANTAGMGSMNVTAANNGGSYTNVLINASTTASRTWTLPDATGTIALVSGSGALVYNSVAGTTQAAVGGNAYILNNAGTTTVTLPASGSSTIGDTIKIKGRSAAAWIIQANTSQIITMGATSSTAAGTATSAAGTDSLQLVYVAANEWSIDWALSSLITLA